MAPEDYSTGQRAFAEFIGVFSIVFFGAGAVVLDLLTAPSQRGAETFTIGGLGFGGLGWVGIALAFWAAVAIPIYVFGKVSGQHINPAVTIAFWLTDRIESGLASIYVLAQLLGAVAGGLVFTLIRGTEAVTAGSMGATLPFPEVTVWQAFLNEIVITFFLLIVIMALAVDERGPSQHVGLVVGFVVAMGVLTTGNISGASFNPARTIGPYATNTIVGVLYGVDAPNLWQYVWIYIFGPMIGAVGGVVLYDYVVLDGISIVSFGGESSGDVETGRES